MLRKPVLYASYSSKTLRLSFWFKLLKRIRFFLLSLESLIFMAKTKRIITVLLRLLALGATLSAAVVMVTSHDSTEVLNLKFSAKYSNSPTFKYFMIAEAVATGYSFIVLFLSSRGLAWRLIVILDVVMTMLLTSSISAALAIAQVGKKGNTHAGWLPICGQVPKFCDHVTGALVAGFAAAVVSLVLNLYSLHAVLSPLFPVKP